MDHRDDGCNLCASDDLTFEPPPIYCTPCGVRIRRNDIYYTVGSIDVIRYFFCDDCYHNTADGETIFAGGTPISITLPEKKVNDNAAEEQWVQCAKCASWQHQICAMFNQRRNDRGHAGYTCPNCYIAEVKRDTLPSRKVLGAKDLPRTNLSNHIEQRLFRKLKQERQYRAKAQRKSFDKVPGADGLVVRVVSSIDKKLEVKQRFKEIFQEENHPTEFPYKSKVILLFQQIEGVEVCLFGMWVQEFGSECQLPNQRSVHLSYVDSVKYFRPDIKTVTGEALRTFVYHHILIGYLEYCKKRGFTSCYIWASPPLKGDDYIFYCHPEIQRYPNSEKLREWFFGMLRKATKENIVVDSTNLYERFFTSTGEFNAEGTATRLPYFDGDYWPGAAEDIIRDLRQAEDGMKQNKKARTEKAESKAVLEADCQSDFSANAATDLMLMHKLGEIISPMKEDFIMVHLHPACSRCCSLMVCGNRWVCKQCKNFQLCDNFCTLMVCGNRWVCKQCKNFQLCDKCYKAELKLEDQDRHPLHRRNAHGFYPVEIINIPSDTKDSDANIECEFFDIRQAFLSLCIENHYQFDTLRRAKHSTMMVLYHLHHPTSPAFVASCNICSLEIEPGQGWHCKECPDYDICNACYQKNGGADHLHELTNRPSMAERDAETPEARQLRVLRLREMIDLLAHVSQCHFRSCQKPNCRKVKGLFRHGIACKVRASKGCVLCKKLWYLLLLHARACERSECVVPRCRSLKDYVRNLQEQHEFRRRAAAMGMMRQRRAEAAGNVGWMPLFCSILQCITSLKSLNINSER